MAAASAAESSPRSRKGRGYTYTDEEDEWLLKTVLERAGPGSDAKLGGNVFWQKLAGAQEDSLSTMRSWQGLRNRYLQVLRERTGDKKLKFDDGYNVDHGNNQYPTRPSKKVPHSGSKESTPRKMKHGAKAKDPYGTGKDHLYSPNGSPGELTRRTRSPARKAAKIAREKIAEGEESGESDDEGSSAQRSRRKSQRRRAPPPIMDVPEPAAAVAAQEEEQQDDEEEEDADRTNHSREDGESNASDSEAEPAAKATHRAGKREATPVESEPEVEEEANWREEEENFEPPPPPTPPPVFDNDGLFSDEDEPARKDRAPTPVLPHADGGAKAPAPIVVVSHRVQLYEIILTSVITALAVAVVILTAKD